MASAEAVGGFLAGEDLLEVLRVGLRACRVEPVGGLEEMQRQMRQVAAGLPNHEQSICTTCTADLPNPMVNGANGQPAARGCPFCGDLFTDDDGEGEGEGGAEAQDSSGGAEDVVEDEGPDLPVPGKPDSRPAGAGGERGSMQAASAAAGGKDKGGKGKGKNGAAAAGTALAQVAPGAVEPEKFSHDDLHRAVVELRKLNEDFAAGGWVLAQRVYEVMRSEVWRVGYKSWDDFVAAELRMSKKWADDLVNVVELKLSREDVVKLGGVDGAARLAGLSEPRRKAIMAKVLAEGLHRREVRKLVSEAHRADANARSNSGRKRHHFDLKEVLGKPIRIELKGGKGSARRAGLQIDAEVQDGGKRLLLALTAKR